jgi:uncharacterized protein
MDNLWQTTNLEEECVHADLQALLALQEEDVAFGALERRERELDDRVRALDGELAGQAAEVERAQQALEEEERRRRELDVKVSEHRQLQEKNLAALEGVWKPREATAAMSQVDLTRRVLAQEESELQAMTGRIVDLRSAAEAQRAELATLQSRQGEARAAIDEERRKLTEEMDAARASRQEKANSVPGGLLTRYERIRTRNKDGALHPLRGSACGRCNTAIPVQRRKTMAGGRSIEMCEGCGVLMYAMD